MKEKNLEEMSLEALWKLFPIVLKPHQPTWYTQFKKEKDRLESTLDLSKIRRIEHIGSTAIKTICAKPSVDILMELKKEALFDAFYEPLKKAGYIVMNKDKDRVSLNKGYTPKGYAKEVFHLHLRSFNNHDELYFRDYLIDFPKEAKVYQALKKDLAQKHKHHRDDYTNQKSAYIKKITHKAKVYYNDKYKG